MTAIYNSDTETTINTSGATNPTCNISWNDALGMEYRKVLGSNARKKIFDREHIDLYTGLGVFFEAERWNWSAVENQNLYTDLNPQSKYIQTEPLLEIYA